MCEEGWYVGLGHEGGCLREGGKTVLNSLKGGGIKKEEKGKKVGGESRVCQVMWALKRGTGTSVRTACMFSKVKTNGWSVLLRFLVNEVKS